MSGSDGLKIALDASNIRAGGGVTHLRCLLAEGEPVSHGISGVHIWANRAVLDLLPERPWLVKNREPMLDRPLPWRVFWQQVVFPGAARRSGCSVIFAPGGTLPLRPGMPTVTMSQNLLPFEVGEAARFGRGGAMWLRLRLLRIAQGWSLRGASGAFFLTEYARRVVERELRVPTKRGAVIPHGVEDRFRSLPRRQHPADEFSESRPFRFTYVSVIDAYKHQPVIVAAVEGLRRRGLPIGVDFVGPERPPYGKTLREAARKADPSGDFIRWCGPCAHDSLPDVYRESDGFVFASSCENLPNILLEAMAGGLPIACSRRGPMPEVLGDAGIYFDPESVAEAAAAMESLFRDQAERERLARRAYVRAEEFTWKRCAHETFRFIAQVGGLA